MTRVGPQTIVRALGAAILLVAGVALAGPRKPARPPAADAGATADAGALAAGQADAGQTSLGQGVAADPDATGDAGAADTAADGGSVTSTCVEHVPPGAKRPVMKEELPPRGLSGYAAELRLVLTHGKGERVLPEGFRLQAGSEAAKALEQAGFVFPDPAGGAAPKITVAPGEGGTAVTTITLPVVPLPPKPGRNVLELPPLPIAVSRANNEYVTLCTKRHRIVVEDPIANELDPKVKPNPPGRQQREDWPLARQVAIGVPIGLALAVLGALLYRWWSRRPKVKAEPPRIPPWVTALAELDRIRRSSLLEEGKRGEHFDQVSDALRRYLGARYGFDTLPEGYNGLETTTGEMLELLDRVRPPIVEMGRIKEFLDDCDLVKFARFTPTTEHCQEALARGETIVRRTIPVMQLPSAAALPAAPPPAPPSPSRSASEPSGHPSSPARPQKAPPEDAP